MIDSSHGASRHIVVIGGVVGGLVGLSAVAGVMWLRRARKKKMVQRHGKVEEVELADRSGPEEPVLSVR